MQSVFHKNLYLLPQQNLNPPYPPPTLEPLIPNQKTGDGSKHGYVERHRPRLLGLDIAEEGLPCLRLCEVSGESEEPDEAGSRFGRTVHMLPERLAARRLQCDWVRADRVARSIQRSGDRRQEPDGALLREHWERARSLPHASPARFPILVVADHMAPGSVLVPHLRSNRLQGEDRRLLLKKLRDIIMFHV